MLENLVDDFVIWAYRNKWLKDYEKREVYEYAIQVILFNVMLILVTFLISLFTCNLPCFMMFIIFFVPLRRCLGGFHFKNKYVCMTISISMYVFVMSFSCKLFQMYKYGIIILWVILSILCLIMQPLKDKNYNKKIISIIFIVNMSVIIIGIYINIAVVAWAILFNMCVLVMFVIQKIFEMISKNDNTKLERKW